MILATKQQLSKIHVLLSQLNLMDEKKNFVLQFSNNRVSSSAKLTIKEAIEFLKYLSEVDPLQKMRKKVFALAYESGIIWGDTPEDKRMNAVKLNRFLQNKGAVKKEINKMNKVELVQTINQLEQMNKHIDESKTAKAVRSVLNELNIPASRK